ncbi:MAG: LysR substrate-binding domain-containing protein [Azospirillaceae bacterium]
MHNLRGIDLNLLVVLDALVAEQHVSRAAERLNMSQSAVSHALARLRDLFDDPILIRRGPAMVATPRALDLAGPLRGALTEIERTVGAGRSAPFDPATARRTVRLGMSDYVAAVLAGDLMPRLRAAAPGIDVVMLTESRETVAEWVATGRLDLAVGVFDDLPPGVRASTLFDDPFVAAVDAANTAIPDPPDLGAYLALPHMMVTVSGRRFGTIDRALSDIGRARRIVATVPHFLVAPRMILGTDIVLTTSSLTFAHAGPAEGGLRLFEPPVPLPTTRITLIRAWRDEDDPLQAWLRGEIASLMAARRPIRPGGPRDAG